MRRTDNTIYNAARQTFRRFPYWAILAQAINACAAELGSICVCRPTTIAHHLLGVQVILVGIGPEVAQTLAGLGVDFGATITRATPARPSRIMASRP